MEWTLQDLLRRTRAEFPDFFNSAKLVRLEDVKIKWSSKKTSMVISALTYSPETRARGGAGSAATLLGIPKSEVPSSRYITLINFYDLKPSLAGTRLLLLPVRVRCSCKAYYFYFIRPNEKVGANVLGSLYKKYVRKTPTWVIPPKNPNNVPGLCKHLIKLANEISSEVLTFDVGEVET